LPSFQKNFKNNKTDNKKNKKNGKSEESDESEMDQPSSSSYSTPTTIYSENEEDHSDQIITLGQKYIKRNETTTTTTTKEREKEQKKGKNPKTDNSSKRSKPNSHNYNNPHDYVMLPSGQDAISLPSKTLAQTKDQGKHSDKTMEHFSKSHSINNNFQDNTSNRTYPTKTPISTAISMINDSIEMCQGEREHGFIGHNRANTEQLSYNKTNTDNHQHSHNSQLSNHSRPQIIELQLNGNNHNEISSEGSKSIRPYLQHEMSGIVSLIQTSMQEKIKQYKKVYSAVKKNHFLGLAQNLGEEDIPIASNVREYVMGKLNLIAETDRKLQEYINMVQKDWSLGIVGDGDGNGERIKNRVMQVGENENSPSHGQDINQTDIQQDFREDNRQQDNPQRNASIMGDANDYYVDDGYHGGRRAHERREAKEKVKTSKKPKPPKTHLEKLQYQPNKPISSHTMNRYLPQNQPTKGQSVVGQQGRAYHHHLQQPMGVKPPRNSNNMMIPPTLNIPNSFDNIMFKPK